MGHGIYTGRPRGVFSAGSEEPNAIVQVRWPSGVSEPSLRATVVEIADGLEAWSLAGRGRLEGEDRGRFDRKFVHVETLVVGGGAAGRAAAAAKRDGRVLLVDEGPVVEPIEGVQVLARATALGIYDHGYVLVAERRPGHRTEGRLWHIRADRIVLATGALERPIPFPGNDRPGIMLASAAAAYVERYGVLPGRRFALATTNDSGSRPPSVLQACGRGAGRGRRPAPGRACRRHRGGRCCWCPAAGTRTSLSGPRPAAASGSTTGSAHTSRMASCGTSRSSEQRPATGCRTAPRPTWDGTGDEDTTFVDLERDATVADIRRALGAGLTSIEHVKRYTTIGTGSDQGKTGGVLASAVAAALLGQEPGALGVPTYRPPYVPVSFAQLAGRDRGALHDPVRTTSIHAWHVDARGGVRGRRPVEAAALLPARRRVDGRRRAARGSGGSPFRGGDGRLDPRQDRPPGPGRRRLPRPHLHEPLLEPGRRRVPLRADVPRRRHGLRRRRHQPPQRRPLAHDHDDRERGAGARVARGVAPDRVAGAAGPRHVGHGAVGDDRRRGAEVARRPAGAGAGPARSKPRTSRS